jgi:hypothetical protein
MYWRDSNGYVGWTNLDGSNCAILSAGNDIAVHGTATPPCTARISTHRANRAW